MVGRKRWFRREMAVARQIIPSFAEGENSDFPLIPAHSRLLPVDWQFMGWPRSFNRGTESLKAIKDKRIFPGFPSFRIVGRQARRQEVVASKKRDRLR